MEKVTQKDSPEKIEQFLRDAISHMLANRSDEPAMNQMQYDKDTRQLTIYDKDGSVHRASITQI